MSTVVVIIIIIICPVNWVGGHFASRQLPIPYCYYSLIFLLLNLSRAAAPYLSGVDVFCVSRGNDGTCIKRRRFLRSISSNKRRQTKLRPRATLLSMMFAAMFTDSFHNNVGSVNIGNIKVQNG
jgi:hypothetical protein